jgi:hypothetical protein
MATTSTTLDDNAANPAKVKTSAVDIEQHDLAEQIEFDRYKATKAAQGSTKSPLSGMRITKVGLGGTTGNA